MNPQPDLKVSVIIPTFNRSDILKRAIGSVISQTYRSLEIIVIDDGSTDDTREIVEEFSSVKYYFQKNEGVASARSHGIRRATGELIAFLDSDDEWVPQKLEWQADIFKKNPNLKWCSSNYYEISLSNTRRQLAHSLSRDDSRILDKNGYFSSFFEPKLCDGLTHTSGMLIKRSVFLELGEFIHGLKYGDDTEMWFRIAFKFPSMGYCTRPCFRVFLRSEESLSGNFNQRCGMWFVFEKILQLAKTQPASIKSKVRCWVNYSVFMYYLRLSLESQKKYHIDVLEWTKSFPPSFFQNITISAIKILPRPIAESVVYRLCELIRFYRHRL